MPRPVPPLLVADSFLLVDGRVRRLDLHRQRFLASCQELLSRPTLAADAGAFWDEAMRSLPRHGEWFPRIEAVPDGDEVEFRLALRPAPERSASVQVALALATATDPRILPLRKGPDLNRLAAFRARWARVAGAEVLLRAADGTLLEGTTANLFWWHGDVLCTPAPELPVLPGVTAAAILQRAGELGIPVQQCRASIDELDGREAWLVNALHGIRPVTRWLNSSISAGPAGHAPDWQTWLDAQRKPPPHATTSGGRASSVPEDMT